MSALPPKADTSVNHRVSPRPGVRKLRVYCRTSSIWLPCLYYFSLAVVVVRYETRATARWALLFIVRAFFNDTITVAFWTGLHACASWDATPAPRLYPCRLEIDCKLILGRRLDWHVGTPPGLLRVISGHHAYSITSSAVASNDCGRVRPSDFAVLRFTTSSNFVGACTGISAGFSPFRMRSTYPAARRTGSLVLGP